MAGMLPTVSHSSGSTIPVFVVDVNNPASFTFSGSSVNSSVTESANSISGTATSLTYENSTVTNSLVFGSGRYLTFSNNVKPNIANGASIQIVANLTASSYNSSWPRVLEFGSTSYWGSGYDNFSIQLSDSGQIQIYMSRSGTSGVYTCGSTNNAVIANAFASYSIQVGPSGVCRIAVDGNSLATTNSEASTTFAGKVPNTATTMNFRVGSMAYNAQSILPNGKIRSVIFSSGTTTTNSVTFMENAGTGYMASQLSSVNQSLNLNTYTRSGYTFTGWNTKSDGTGTAYANGDTFSFSTKSSILFAQWSVVPPSLSLSLISNATYRTNYPIALTINSAGRYTFFSSGKKIAGCVNRVGTPPTVTCNWKPSRRGTNLIRATGSINGTSYSSNSPTVLVVSRSTQR
jgi:hypothetical protein